MAIGNECSDHAQGETVVWESHIVKGREFLRWRAWLSSAIGNKSSVSGQDSCVGKSRHKRQRAVQWRAWLSSAIGNKSSVSGRDSCVGKSRRKRQRAVQCRAWLSSAHVAIISGFGHPFRTRCSEGQKSLRGMAIFWGVFVQSLSFENCFPLLQRRGYGG